MKVKLNRKIILIAILAVTILLISIYFIANINSQNNQEEETTQEIAVEPNESQLEPEEETVVQKVVEEEPTQQRPEPEAAPAPSQWPVLLSLDQASSLTVVVNKKHKLPESYAPGLRSVTSSALSQLTSAASSAGIGLKTISSYRSYATQVSTYNKWVNQSGQAAADTFSARPGHSEHQTGLAVDVGASNNSSCDLETCFGNTAEGKWVAANAQNYGFIIRYPNGKDAITGYQYEPWHLRYVGVDVAKAVVASGLTLDQYYGIEGGGYN
jgi:D-alanyl-D-alanine carboxypeptidase